MGAVPTWACPHVPIPTTHSTHSSTPRARLGTPLYRATADRASCPRVWYPTFVVFVPTRRNASKPSSLCCMHGAIEPTGRAPQGYPRSAMCPRRDTTLDGRLVLFLGHRPSGSQKEHPPHPETPGSAPPCDSLTLSLTLSSRSVSPKIFTFASRSKATVPFVNGWARLPKTVMLKGDLGSIGSGETSKVGEVSQSEAASTMSGGGVWCICALEWGDMNLAREIALGVLEKGSHARLHVLPGSRLFRGPEASGRARRNPLHRTPRHTGATPSPAATAIAPASNHPHPSRPAPPTHIHPHPPPPTPASPHEPPQPTAKVRAGNTINVRGPNLASQFSGEA